mgnify:CR=1 FL=1
MLQVAAYCRVSTDKEDQANSFEAQQRYFREYIQRQPDWELQGIYADEGFSGTSTNKRVEFNKMLHAAELGQIDLIVTKEVSRFTRNTVDALQITRELRRRGVGVLFLNDSLDTRTNDGELRLTIMSSVAQDESRKTSERSKWGQMRSMEKGVVFGGSLLGYDVIGGKMTVNPEGAEVVRLIFHKYLQERKGCSTIARELREAGGEAVSFRADLTKAEEAKALIDFAVQQYGHLDILVNNAGISQIKLFTDIAPEEWRQMFAANVDGIYHCCRAAVPYLVQQHSGTIINVSSIWGLCGASCEVHYSASKAAVIGFTQALAKELAPSGITINCVAPGAIDTEMNAHLTTEERRMLEEEIPLGRMGSPEEVAAAIAFLAGEDARYFTGQVLSPNGGIVI